MLRKLCLLPLLANPLSAEELRIVTDIGPVNSLVAMVAGNHATVTTLLPPGASPHDLALRPSQARDLSEADLVVWVGPSLAPGLETALDTIAANAPIMALENVPGILTLEARDAEDFASLAMDDHDDHDHDEAKHDDHDDHDHDEAKHNDHDDHDHDEAKHNDHDDHDHEEAKHDDHDDHDHDEAKHDDHDDHDHDEAKHDDHGDHGHEESGHDDHGHAHDHGGTDPHFWLSPDNAKLWVTAIAAELSERAPDHAAEFAANAEAALDAIEATEAAALAQLAAAQGEVFAVYHDAFRYLEDAFDLTVIGAISNSEAAQSGPGSMATLRDRIAEMQPACMLSEPGFNAGLVDAVGASDIPAVILDPLGADLDQGAGMYPALITALAGQIADCVSN